MITSYDTEQAEARQQAETRRRAALERLSPRVEEALAILPEGDTGHTQLAQAWRIGDPADVEQTLTHWSGWVDSYRSEAITRQREAATRTRLETKWRQQIPARLTEAAERDTQALAARQQELVEAERSQRALASARPTDAAGDLAYAQNLSAADSVVRLRRERVSAAEMQAQASAAAVAEALQAIGRRERIELENQKQAAERDGVVELAALERQMQQVRERYGQRVMEISREINQIDALLIQ